VDYPPAVATASEKSPFVPRVREWLHPKPLHGVQRDPRAISLAHSLLFGAGGLLVLMTLGLPHSPNRNVAGLVGAASTAICVAVITVAIGRRWPLWAFKAQPFLGGVLVSVVALSGGTGAVTAYAMFYFWVILAAFYFFPGLCGALNLLAVGAQYAIVAHVSGTLNAELKWVMLMGTLVVGAVFLAFLQDYAERGRGERERLLARVEQLASTDPLTSLPNRRAWQAHLVHELRNAAVSGSPLAVVILDLDGLKEINDVGGHPAGDRVILRATAGWQSALRDTDFIARLGGDEFGVLLPNCPEDVALAVLKRMREATPSIAWSAGIAVWDGEERARVLLRRADAYLYEAKRGGRNRAATAAAA
jgi:diguanylate cyclase (GGDEF)-like protein